MTALPIFQRCDFKNNEIIIIYSSSRMFDLEHLNNVHYLALTCHQDYRLGNSRKCQY